VGKLTPLGDPAPNAPKWFAAVEMIQLAADKDWLHKAAKEISKYWRIKRERRHRRTPVRMRQGNILLKADDEKLMASSSSLGCE
jgi:DMSO/TMAO reductase YedYZ molybdopterin-dependent catalytic subunit